MAKTLQDKLLSLSMIFIIIGSLALIGTTTRAPGGIFYSKYPKQDVNAEIYSNPSTYSRTQNYFE